MFYNFNILNISIFDSVNYRPKQVELIEIINKPLLLHLVGYLYYWQMGFNSVFKGLMTTANKKHVSEGLLTQLVQATKAFSFTFERHTVRLSAQTRIILRY